MANNSGKTLAPSDKRLRDARKKGQVGVSRDMTGAAVFVVIFAVVSLTAATWLLELVGYFQTSFVLANQGGSMQAHLARGLTTAIDVLEAPLLAGLVTAVVVGLVQTKGLFSPGALAFDPQRLLPNFKRLVSPGTVMELLKGFIKVFLAGALAWTSVTTWLGALTHLAGMKASNILVVLGHGGQSLGNRLVLVVAVVGCADFLWQKHAHMKSLRMSRDELEHEHRESEGDPQLKRDRQRIHQQLLEQRMVNDVSKASFVVVNPNHIAHIALAIRYDQDSDAAPVVLAKGARLVAERIERTARDAGVPIFTDSTLAQALGDVAEGGQVPEVLYEAVAEILRLVYRNDGPVAAPTGPAPARTPALTSDAPRATWRRA